MFDTGAWFLILQTFQRLNSFFIFKNINEKDDNEFNKNENQLVNSDLSIIINILDSTFSKSYDYNNELLLMILDALN